MFDLDMWREIFQSVNKNKTRSILSGFTVAFAILLFTLLFGLANGLENTFRKFFSDDAQNAVFINSGKTTLAFEGLQMGRQIQFTNDDLKFLEKEFKNQIQYRTARVEKSMDLAYKMEKGNYTCTAVMPDARYIDKAIVSEGRFINENDVANNTRVAVIGRLVAEDLFSTESALGKYVSFSGIVFKVVGVFSDDGGDREERGVYLPLSTIQTIYGANQDIDAIDLTYEASLNFNQANRLISAIERKLKKRLLVSPDDQRAIRIYDMTEESQSTNAILFGLGMIILIIGFGTLIAGIVGISNIMIYAVKERTKELGVRKALGAKPKDIIKIILYESIIITTVAGYIGLLIGSSILNMPAVNTSLKKYFITDPSVSTGLLIGATITLIIAGSLAGYLPAKRAAKIKPIEALRQD
jgi:putative ABC transport system permease protein